MDSPGFHTDQDLAFAHGRFGLLQNLYGLESAEASEDDSAHLLGRRGLFLFLLYRLLRCLLGRGLGSAILSRGRGLLGRCGRGCLRAFRHVFRVSKGCTVAVRLTDAVRMSPDKYISGSRPARRRVAERMTRGKGEKRAQRVPVRPSGVEAPSERGARCGLQGQATGRGTRGGRAHARHRAANRWPPRRAPAGFLPALSVTPLTLYRTWINFIARSITNSYSYY